MKSNNTRSVALASVALLLGSLGAACGPAPYYYGPPQPHPQPHPQPQPQPDPTPEPGPAWNSVGWTLLGTRVVDGRYDRDTLEVGAYAGKIDQLTLVVTDSALQLGGLTVQFANGGSFDPKVQQWFGEGSRTRQIDLPGNDRLIRAIDLRYGNVPGGGRASVEVWGRNVAEPTPAPVFDSKGWTLLGEAGVAARSTRSTLRLSHTNRVDQVTMVVTGGDLDVSALSFTFANGAAVTPTVRQTFKDGARTRAIELPGNDRKLTGAELSYAAPAGSLPTVQFWGRDVGSPVPAPAWDPKGWTKLGDATVDGRKDHDTVKAAKVGRIDQITMLVLDSELDLTGLTVTFANGETFTPSKVQHRFAEGQRSRVIDLPGNDRTIKSFDVAYANLPGGGKARVELWGRNIGSKPVSVWDATGWTKLGTEQVRRAGAQESVKVEHKGRVDQLTLVVTGGDLDVASVRVNFANGNTFTPALRHVFKDGARTRVIDLPGNDRIIKHVELRMTKSAGGGEANVQIYGRDIGSKPVVTAWDSKGWKMLGETPLDGATAAQAIELARKQGAFQDITLVMVGLATGAEVTATAVELTYGDGSKFATGKPLTFTAVAAAQGVTIPGKPRAVNKVKFSAAGLTRDSRVTLQIWAK